MSENDQPELQFNEPSLLKIECDVKTFMKEIFLASSLDVVKRVFRNAAVFSEVHWESIIGLQELWQGIKNNEPILTKEQIWEKIKKGLTVVPITPEAIFEDRSQITSWKIDSLFTNSATIGAKRHLSSDLNRLILSRAETMKVIFNGEIYSSPCKFCKNIFKRVSGDCPIAFKNHKNQLDVCTPKFVLAKSFFYQPEETEETEVGATCLTKETN